MIQLLMTKSLDDFDNGCNWLNFGNLGCEQDSQNG